MEAKIKHLELVQSVVARMAANSFLLRGWAASVVVGLYALSHKDITYGHLVFSILVTFAFALLDGYYLSKERAFRKLYDEVRQTAPSDIDFSLDIKHLDSGKNWLHSSVSTTILLLYLGLLAAQILFVKLISIV